MLGAGGMYVVNYLTQDLTFYEHPTRSIEWDQLSGMRGGREGDMVRYALNRREPLRVQWEAFIDAVRCGESPTVRGGDALAALSTARAIQRAGVEHQVVVPQIPRAQRRLAAGSAITSPTALATRSMSRSSRPWWTGSASVCSTSLYDAGRSPGAVPHAVHEGGFGMHRVGP